MRRSLRQAAMSLLLALLVAGAFSGALWGGAVLGGGFAPGADGPFFFAGTAALAVAIMVTAIAWRVLVHLFRLTRPSWRALFPGLTLALPALGGMALASARIMAGGPTLPQLLLSAAPTLLSLLALLAVGLLVWAATR